MQAIERMVDEDVPCEDILAQINAVKSALHKVGQVVLEGHIQHCVRDGKENFRQEQKKDASSEVLFVFLILKNSS